MKPMLKLKPIKFLREYKKNSSMTYSSSNSRLIITIFRPCFDEELFLSGLRFSASHDFTKPNDISALNLMNSCGAAVLDEFEDIIFAYGASDEFSFVLRKDSKLYDRHRSEVVVSAIVSFFTSMYIMKWKEFFQQKELQYHPSFDGRAVCYPSLGILRDYLSWRQVDCYINYQNNTCKKLLVDSGCDAQNILQGMSSQKKNDMLKNIDSDKSLEIFRRGSCIFWDKTCVDSNILLKIYHLCKFWNQVKTLSCGPCGDDSPWKIVIEHCDIIKEAFWKAHPWILCEERSGPSA